MRIWNGQIELNELNALNKGTLGEHMQIEFTAMGDDYLEATMPVNQKTKQPFGLLHGGASVALAETVGSVASWCLVNRELFIGVGVDINATHLKAVREGTVKAVCRPLKFRGQTHVWDIRIFDGSGDLCCVCRFTAMAVKKPQ